MSSGVSAANLSTLRLMWLLLSCTHSALRHTKSSGDLNGDGQIRVVDAVIALQMAVSGGHSDDADAQRVPAACWQDAEDNAVGAWL